MAKGKTASPRGKGKRSTVPDAPPCNTSLASLVLTAADGSVEPLLPNTSVPATSMVPLMSRNKVALPPGSAWVSVTAVAQDRNANVRIFRWDPSCDPKLRKDVSMLHLTSCRETNLSREALAVRHIQARIRGMITRDRIAAAVAMARGDAAQLRLRLQLFMYSTQTATALPNGGALELGQDGGTLLNSLQQRWRQVARLHDELAAHALEAKARVPKPKKSSKKGSKGKDAARLPPEPPAPPAPCALLIDDLELPEARRRIDVVCRQRRTASPHTPS